MFKYVYIYIERRNSNNHRNTIKVRTRSVGFGIRGLWLKAKRLYEPFKTGRSEGLHDFDAGLWGGSARAKGLCLEDHGTQKPSYAEGNYTYSYSNPHKVGNRIKAK